MEKIAAFPLPPRARLGAGGWNGVGAHRFQDRKKEGLPQAFGSRRSRGCNGVPPGPGRVYCEMKKRLGFICVSPAREWVWGFVFKRHGLSWPPYSILCFFGFQVRSF